MRLKFERGTLRIKVKLRLPSERYDGTSKSHERGQRKIQKFSGKSSLKSELWKKSAENIKMNFGEHNGEADWISLTEHKVQETP